MQQNNSGSTPLRLLHIRQNGKPIQERDAGGSPCRMRSTKLIRHGHEISQVLQYKDSDVLELANWLREAMMPEGILVNSSEAVACCFRMWSSVTPNEFLDQPRLRCFQSYDEMNNEIPEGLYGSIPEEFINFGGLIDDLRGILACGGDLKPWLRIGSLSQYFRCDRRTIERYAEVGKIIVDKSGSVTSYSLRSTMLAMQEDLIDKKAIKNEFPAVVEWFERR